MWFSVSKFLTRTSHTRTSSSCAFLSFSCSSARPKGIRLRARPSVTAYAMVSVRNQRWPSNKRRLSMRSEVRSLRRDDERVVVNVIDSYVILIPGGGFRPKIAPSAWPRRSTIESSRHTSREAMSSDHLQCRGI